MRTKQSVAVGVEIGGRGATIALVDTYGSIRHRLYAKTLWGRPATATLQPYLRSLDAMLAYASAEGLRITGLGVSVPGSLDEPARRPYLIPTLPAFNGFPLCDLLEARYGFPTRLYVDVDAAVLGEYHFGAGKGFRRLLFLAINAVAGAALIIDGKVEQCEPQHTGHVCHIPVSTNGPRCSCGKRGCINTLVSADAIQRMVLRALRRGDETSLAQRLSNRESFSLRLLAEEALQGDSVALQVYSEVGRWLAAAAGRYVNMFAPDMLILGGSVFGASELLLAQVRNALIAEASLGPYRMPEVASASLGSDATLIGTVAHFLVNDGAAARQPKMLADAVPTGQQDLSEDILDDRYPVHADVVTQQTRRRKAKSYQQRTG